MIVVAIAAGFACSGCGSAKDLSSQGGLITLSANQAAIPSDGRSSIQIVAVLTDRTGNPVFIGTTVRFTTTAGQFQNGNRTFSIDTSDDTGTVFVSLTAALVPGVATVTANANGVTQAISVVFLQVGAAADIDLVADPDSVDADGTSPVLITATILDGFELPVDPGTVVVFNTTLGRFDNESDTFATVTTDTSGVVRAILIAAEDPGIAIVRCTAGVVTREIAISFTGAGAPGAVASMSLDADPASIPADGFSTSQITATLLDIGGLPVALGTAISCTTSAGTLSSGSQSFSGFTTTAEGTVSFALISEESPGIATVVCRSNGIERQINVSFAGDEPVGAPAQMTVEASPTSIPADGISTADITATLVDRNAQPVGVGAEVTFSTTGGTLPNGKTEMTTFTANEDGQAVAALTSDTNPRTVTVRARTRNGIQRQVSVEFTGDEEPGLPAQMTLEAVPTSIQANGISTTTITATLLDRNAQPVEIGSTVVFSTNGGTLPNGTTQITAFTSNAQGQAETSLTSDTTPRTVIVRARTINGIERQVVIEFTAAPEVGDPASMTLTADPTSIDADGFSVSTLTATVLNLSGQPVAVGTPVNFTTTLGTFSNGSTTFTELTSDADGNATVTLIAGTTAGIARITASTDNGISRVVNVELQ